MIKICTILGTRPEIIRLSKIIPEFDKHFDHTLINTNQNFTYDLNKVFFESLRIRKPNYQYSTNVKESFTTLSNMFHQTEKTLLKVKPDAVFILGDTDSSLCSIIAKRLKIPVFHYEAGNRCFDEVVPEEINRKIIDSISDINFTYTSFAKENLIKEGKPIQDVVCVGSPMKEVLEFYWTDILNSNILEKLELKNIRYSILSVHRQETVNNEAKLKKLFDNIEYFSNDLSNIVWPLHPRTKDKIKTFDLNIPKSITVISPQSFQNYIALQRNAVYVLSDSGTLAEETSLLGLKSLNIREQFERQEILGIEVIPLVGLNNLKWKTGINLIKEKKIKDYPSSPVEEYDRVNVSNTIVNNIISNLKKLNF